MFIQTQIIKHRPGNAPVQATFQVNLKRGRIHWLVGPAGSGKSTLLHILQGRQRPDQGLIAVDGRIWFHRDGNRFIETLDREVNGVFGDEVLSRHQTAQAVLARALPQWPPATRAHRVAELLERIGLERLGKRKVLELSSDQCWRLVLARALASKPRLVLLDEPFALLEPEKLGLFDSDLRLLAREEGAAVLLSDSGIRTQGRPGDMILAMAEGRVLRWEPAQAARGRLAG
jgi:ABC-type sulfate/molybdate transport systems ATPase subunit